MSDKDKKPLALGGIVLVCLFYESIYWFLKEYGNMLVNVLVVLFLLDCVLRLKEHAVYYVGLITESAKGIDLLPPFNDHAMDVLWRRLMYYISPKE